MRIHNVITSGGGAPNVVPDFAETYYYVRDWDPAVVRQVLARVRKAADGAAMATETGSSSSWSTASSACCPTTRWAR